MSQDEHTPTDYRVRRLEEWRTDTNQRLEKGADEFAAQRGRFNKFAWGLFVTVVVAAIAIGRVLQRVEDTATSQGANEARIEAVQEDVADTKMEQVKLRSAVERVEEGQDRLEDKLDRALEPKRRR